MTAVQLDLPHADYLAHPALSASGAKQILRSPAHYQWSLTHPEYRAAYDVGTAVHTAVLGTGQDVVVLDYDSWRTKAAQEARADARAAGQVPMLAADYEPVMGMAEAVLAHPIARSILERAGRPEVSLFGQDPDTGVNLRARLDWLPDRDPTRRTTCADLKTAASADPADFRAAAAKYGYDIQDAWYQNLVRLTRGDEDTEFVFIVVEKSAPYLVSVIELDAEFRVIGQARMRRAIDTYKACTESGEWPGYPPIIHTVTPPGWLAYAEELELVF